MLGVTLPPLKHFGPLLLIWGGAMLLLIVIRDLGSSLMFFGAFLALLYVATNRFSFVLIGLLLFGVGAYFLGTHVPHVMDRVNVWQDPLNVDRYPTEGFQIANSLFAQADGGLLGRGFGGALLETPFGSSILPARADRPDLRADRQRARPRRRRRAADRLPDVRASAASRRRCWRETRSRRCWRSASRPSSRCRCS